ncbi:MAG: HEAT repeat domain-containing protein [Leptospirillia bacterium]
MDANSPTEWTEATDAGEDYVRMIRDARELVTHMLRGIKTLRMYDTKNPVHAKALHDLGGRFVHYVEEWGELALTVGKDRIRLGDEVLHQDDDAQQGLAFRLYADGVRMVTFKVGLPEQEARTAVQIFAIGTAATTSDDDIVTLFWDADCSHVDVTAVEDDFEAGELTSTMAEREEVTNLSDVARKEAAPQPDGTPSRVVYGADVLGVFRLTDDERKYLKGLLRKEEAVDPVVEVVGVLKEILLVERVEADFIETVDLFSGLLLTFLEKGNLSAVVSQVEALEEVRDTCEDLTPGMRKAVEDVLNSLGEGAYLYAVQSCMAVLLSETPERPDATSRDEALEKNVADLTNYFARIQQGSPRDLLLLISGSSYLPIREVIYDTVARICPTDHAELTNLLLELDVGMVQGALQVLTRIGDPADVTHFGTLHAHGEASVRRAALEAICSISGGAHISILPFLSDTDVRIRRRAVGVVEASRFSPALEPLQALVADPGFSDWELSERRAVFHAIGVIGGDDMVPFFTGFSGRKKRGWFGGKKDDDESLLAVAGLRAVSTPGARDAIKGFMKDAGQRLRSACETALRDMSGNEGKA